MTFEYVDANGENEMGVECSIDVDLEVGTIRVGVYEGDMDGDRYDIYVPNHRVRLLNLIAELQEVLDLTADWPTGYDGFCNGGGAATDTGLMNSYPEGHILREEHGKVKWFG